ncbi:MAG: DUF1573 domain-containing protein [Bacteroidales bacterium]|nr:DUF1573 domain-containing protein [Bacteroidales bacterium]
MKQKKYILASFFLLLSTAFWAQPKISFKSDVVNMGEIIFQQPKAVEFRLTNTGTAPLQLSSVKPSCGCTSVEWPNSAIAPGQSATITAIYDAQLLGYFQKELEVRSNASKEPSYLTLQGRVVTTTNDVEGNFPVEMGDIRLSTDSITFKDVNRGDRPEIHFYVLNNTRRNIKPELMHLPSYYTATYHPEMLAGGRVGRITLRLNSDQMKSYGTSESLVFLSLHPGEKVSKTNKIHLSATLLPNFRNLSETELKTAPLVVLSAENVDFTDRGGKKKVTKTIILGNAGERDLHINSIQLEGRAINIHVSNRIIKPGKRVKLKVTLLAEHVRANDPDPQILLVTNDPTHPQVNILVKK